MNPVPTQEMGIPTELLVQTAAIMVTIILAAAAAIWAETKSWHRVDLRLENISTTVSPYGADIANLKDQQGKNSADIAEMKARTDANEATGIRHDAELLALRARIK